MAWNFSVQINALTGFDGNLDEPSEEGENYSTLASQWLTDAAKEVIQVLPPHLKTKCSTMTAVSHDTGMDLDEQEDVLYVVRQKTDGGVYIPCRKIPGENGAEAEDPDSLMYYATPTDPVYYIQSHTNDSLRLFAKPTPSSDQQVQVFHVTYPSISYNATEIDNFPNEAEHLVVLRAAITALQHKMTYEEDPELFLPILQSLRSQYHEGLQVLVQGSLTSSQQGAK
jgi:hypothetical protein